MVRKLRIEYPGAIYHVMNRGDQRENIYRGNAERERFLRTLPASQTLLSRLFQLPISRRLAPCYARMPVSTSPCTSVKRRSMPLW